MDPQQTNLQLHFFLFNFPLCFSPTTTLLGVIFDRTLSFSRDGSSQKAKFFPGLRVLRRISASLLGPYNESLFCIKLLFDLFSLILHPKRFPILSVINVTKLERLYRAGRRAIIGCLLSSATRLLLSEASLPTLRVTLTHFAP